MQADHDVGLDAEVVRIWNQCVRTSPAPNQLGTVLGGRALREIRPGVSDYLVTTDGIFIRLPLGRSRASASGMQAIGLCTDGEYFEPSGLQPRRVEAALYLGDIRLSQSAASVLTALTDAGLRPLDTSTDRELFTIIVGRSLILEFLPNGPVTVDPRESRLAAVQFNFGPEYTATRDPLLSLSPKT